MCSPGHSQVGDSGLLRESGEEIFSVSRQRIGRLKPSLHRLGANEEESCDRRELRMAIPKWQREALKKERRRRKAWKKRNRKREAQNEAHADVLWRLEQLANFVPSGR